MNDDGYEDGDFLKKRPASQMMNGVELFRSRQVPRGIASSKKNDILRQLCPLMPTNRQEFWKAVAVNEQSADLIDE